MASLVFRPTILKKCKRELDYRVVLVKIKISNILEVEELIAWERLALIGKTFEEVYPLDAY